MMSYYCTTICWLWWNNKAACELVKKLKPKKVYVNFIIELKELNGKAVFGDDVEIESVLSL